MNKVLLLVFLCLVVTSCQRHRTPIGNGYCYSSQENNRIDGRGPVDLEYSEVHGEFVTIYRNLSVTYGGVVVHDKLVVFCAHGEKGAIDMFAATPKTKPVRIDPIIQKKMNLLSLPNAPSWNWDYGLLKYEGEDDGLIVTIFCNFLVGREDLPKTVKLKFDWSEIESVAIGEEHPRENKSGASGK